MGNKKGLQQVWGKIWASKVVINKYLYSEFALTEEESRLFWQPVISFERLMEFKVTPVYGHTDSSGSWLLPWNKSGWANRKMFILIFFHFWPNYSRNTRRSGELA